MELTEELLWVWMTKLGRPIAKAISLVYEIYGSPENAWYDKKTEDWDEKNNKLFFERVRDESLKELAIAIYDCANGKNMRIITKNSPVYPKNLLQCYNAPPVLYCIGKLPEEADPQMSLLSVVGSRACTNYGRNVTYRLAKELADYNVGIVSGLARGIDISAHIGALDGGGYTIAVLGGGADVVYPPEHRKIYEQICEKGCIISEHPPTTEPLKNFFPARNRIIAGLSMGTLITEAGKSSGAMITVDRALEEGRDVFALPGNIDSKASEGTNDLIKRGGICVTCAADILEELLGIYQSGAGKNEEELYRLLPEEEKMVLKLISECGGRPESCNTDCGLSPGKISAILTRLEVKGIIERMSSGTWLVKKFFTT